VKIQGSWLKFESLCALISSKLLNHAHISYSSRLFSSCGAMHALLSFLKTGFVLV
jgi:hypothetical protein